jgi:hypothetical protein
VAFLEPVLLRRAPAATEPTSGPAWNPTDLIIQLNANNAFPWIGRIVQPVTADTIRNLNLPLILNIGPIINIGAKVRFVQEGTRKPVPGEPYVVDAIGNPIKTTGVSDANGEATIEVRDDVKTGIECGEPGNGAFYQVIIQPGTVQKLGLIEIVVPAPQITGDVLVQDGSGVKPFESGGAELSVVQNVSGNTSFRTIDVRGSKFYAYHLDPGDWQIQLPNDPKWNSVAIVSGAMFHIDRDATTNPGHAQLVLRRAASFALQIFVKDQNGGGTVPGAAISIQSDGAPLTGVTDGDGKLKFDSLKEGKYTVTVTAQDLRPSRSILDFSKGQDLNVTLTEYPKIKVSLRDETGQPVKDAFRIDVIAFSPGSHESLGISNSDGDALVSWQWTGPFCVAVLQGQYIAGVVRVEKVADDSINVVVHKASPVTADVQVPAQLQGLLQLVLVDPDTKLPIARRRIMISNTSGSISFSVMATAKRALAYIEKGNDYYKGTDVDLAGAVGNKIQISITADDLKRPLTQDEILGVTAAKGK